MLKDKFLRFEKEVDLLHRINMLKTEINNMISESHTNTNNFNDDIIELSQYLDKLIVAYMNEEIVVNHKKDSRLNFELAERFRQQLQEKDFLYRYLFENHSSVMLIIDAVTGIIVEANQAAIEYYGYKKEELLTMTIQEINIDDEDQVKEDMSDAETETRNYFQFIHRLSNNEQREVEVYSFPIKMENRNLLFSTIYDISGKLEQKLMFNTLFFDSPYGVAILDKEQKIVNINKNFSKLFQYSIEDIKGKGIHVVSTSSSQDQIDNNIKTVYEGKVVKQEGIRKRKDGELVNVEILGYPVINHHEVIGVYVIYIDNSDKKSYERQLLLFRKILENTSEGVVITNTYGEIQWSNDAYHKITGYSYSELLGKTQTILKSGRQGQNFYKLMWKELKAKEKWSGEIWNKNKDGHIFSGCLKINSIKNELGEITHYVGVFKDLSEKKMIDRRMKDLLQKDFVTGLYNRDYFLQNIDTFITNNREKKIKFFIIVIHIEDFRELNNSVGHHIGDKLLIKFSQKLLHFNKRNFLLSRVNEGEFAIFCKYSAKQDVVEYISELLQKLNKAILIDTMTIHVNVNMGISTYPVNGRDAETLIQYANIAVYKAKDQFDNQICFYDSIISNEIEYKFLLANHLSEAISKYEFSIYYQPIFDIQKDHTILGAEALLRWKNIDLGMVEPQYFIPIAEKTGQILKIGEWVLEQVCQQISIWQRKGYKVLPISINISVKQLEKIGFYQTVSKILKKNNIKPQYIELEITESVSLGDSKTIVHNLKEIKKNGIKISMDDFGTGYSSLGQLDIFELDKIKIDKVFIDDLVKVHKRQKLVKSIIAMAKSLELVVVAEGIETHEQLLCLQKLGCELGQGYLFSKPLGIDEYEALLKSYIV